MPFYSIYVYHSNKTSRTLPHLYKSAIGVESMCNKEYRPFVQIKWRSQQHLRTVASLGRHQSTGQPPSTTPTMYAHPHNCQKISLNRIDILVCVLHLLTMHVSLSPIYEDPTNDIIATSSAPQCDSSKIRRQIGFILFMRNGWRFPDICSASRYQLRRLGSSAQLSRHRIS